VKKRKWERKRRRGKKKGVGEKTNQREGERKRGKKEPLNKHKSSYSELS
jgi:hypothetical protein